MNRYATSKDVKECVTAESGLQEGAAAVSGERAGRLSTGQGVTLPAGDRAGEGVRRRFTNSRAPRRWIRHWAARWIPRRSNTYLESAYNSFHGSLEGLDQLKNTAKASPLPPADLKIETATAIATKKQAEFEQSNPQLALWMRIKGALADTNGATYFENELKDSAVPPMKGTLLEGKPACKSKELLVAIPLPDQQGNPVAEITLKLDAPLTRQAGNRGDDSVDRSAEGIHQGSVHADHGDGEGEDGESEDHPVRRGSRQESGIQEEVGGSGNQENAP